MAARAQRDNPARSKELHDPPVSIGQFEDIPKIPRVAGELTGHQVKDQVVIVTGANSPLGIGRAAAHNFAGHGARALYLCDYNPSHLPMHVRELRALHPACEVFARELDTTSEPAVAAVCEDAIQRFGRLDVMFANAGIHPPAFFADVSAESFMRTVQGNLLSAFLCAKHGAAAMQKVSRDKQYPRGSVVMTASTAGLRSNAGDSAYSAAKAGVVSLAQTLAYQLAGTGIRVNCVCPGIIETGMTQVMYEYARARGTEKKIGQLNPLKRGGVADEVARVVLFLGSEQASYVNGQAWAVDGGLSAGHPHVPGKLA